MTTTTLTTVQRMDTETLRDAMNGKSGDEGTRLAAAAEYHRRFGGPATTFANDRRVRSGVAGMRARS